MRHIYADGGRKAAGFTGSTGDCVVRAVALASGRSYTEVYEALSRGMATQRNTKRGKAAPSARNGVNVTRKWFRDYMHSIGATWTACMSIGSGCKVHMRAEELPRGALVVALSKHYAAVVDGILYDTHDCTRAGTRCVYGYWRFT